MKRAALLTLVVVLAPAGLRAGDREFKNVVDELSTEFHKEPMHIPFFGIAKLVTFVAHPAGAKQLDLAIFQDLDVQDREGRNLGTAIRRAVGPQWKPFFQASSLRHGNNEHTFIYLREDSGSDWKLLLTTVGRDQAVVLELKMNPEALQRWINQPRDQAHHWDDSH
jgi:hypothetical protein